MCFFSMYAQHSAKDCLYDLYKVLSTCHNKDYIGIGDCNYSISSLYQGKNERIIFDAIKNACIFSYGNPLDSVVEVNLLKFPTLNTVFSFPFACRPPYSLTFNTRLIEVM